MLMYPAVHWTLIQDSSFMGNLTLVDIRCFHLKFHFEQSAEINDLNSTVTAKGYQSNISNNLATIYPRLMTNSNGDW